MIPIVRRERKLARQEDVYTQNAWDDIDWTREMIEAAELRLQQQRQEAKHSINSENEIQSMVTLGWDDFYGTHGDKFFKDRRWILSEFPEILPFLDSDSPDCEILEVGCGVGNAIAHILGSNRNPKLHIYGCDLSTNAINTLVGREIYARNKDKLTVFQADIQNDFDSIQQKVKSESLDFITIIFTLSALIPDRMELVIKNLASLLKPGGLIMYRDYAQYDLTQLRFKGKAYISDNYYVRADGTTTYFFTKSLVQDLFKSAQLTEVELKTDNRLLVNRSKSLKMCRCWIQAKYRK